MGDPDKPPTKPANCTCGDWTWDSNAKQWNKIHNPACPVHGQ
jgi:hypothetical protein